MSSGKKVVEREIALDDIRSSVTSESLSTVDLKPLYDSNIDNLKRLCSNDEDIQLFLVQGKKTKKYLTDKAKEKNVGVVVVDKMRVKVIGEDVESTDITFPRLCSMISVYYYLNYVKKMDNSDIKSGNFIIPSLIKGCPMTNDVDYDRMFCLGSPGAQFAPKLLKENSLSKKEIGGAVTVCSVVDYVVYCKQNKDSKYSYKEFMKSDAFMDSRNTLKAALRNLGEDYVKKMVEPGEAENYFPMMKTLLGMLTGVETSGEAAKRTSEVIKKIFEGLKL